MSVSTTLPPHHLPYEIQHAYPQGISGPSQRSKARRERLTREVEPKVLGPMPVQGFLGEFFPTNPWYRPGALLGRDWTRQNRLRFHPRLRLAGQ